MDKSVQKIMDEKMCRPGYVWNDTLKKCLAAGYVEVDKSPNDEKPGAPAEPVGNGRGDVRVNANGVKQTGTKMGSKVSIK